MSDDGSPESNSLMRRRIRAVLALDATATALTFGGRDLSLVVLLGRDRRP